jgi:polar amino acid transport system permease protein
MLQLPGDEAYQVSGQRFSAWARPMNFDMQAVLEALPYFGRGLINTLLLTLLGILFSTILGVICAVFRVSRNKGVRLFLEVYIEIFRNTPIVAQVFFLYFALPLIGIRVSAFNCGLIALVLHYNAYNIEVFRSGLEAVPLGLHEAGQALAFSYIQRLRLIVFPIALRICLPALVNNYVSLLKNTALVSIIGVVEITFVAQDIIADNFTYFEMYTVVSAIYLVLVFSLTWLLRVVEKRYSIPD